jgi:sec-independent protein translocase protein TatA
VFNIGPLELLVILVVALLVFGPEKLPEIGNQVGRALREFHKFQQAMQANVRDVVEPLTGPIIPNGPIPPAPSNGPAVDRPLRAAPEAAGDSVASGTCATAVGESDGAAELTLGGGVRDGSPPGLGTAAADGSCASPG